MFKWLFLAFAASLGLCAGQTTPMRHSEAEGQIVKLFKSPSPKVRIPLLSKAKIHVLVRHPFVEIRKNVTSLSSARPANISDPSAANRSQISDLFDSISSLSEILQHLMTLTDSSKIVIQQHGNNQPLVGRRTNIFTKTLKIYLPEDEKSNSILSRFKYDEKKISIPDNVLKENLIKLLNHSEYVKENINFDDVSVKYFQNDFSSTLKKYLLILTISCVSIVLFLKFIVLKAIKPTRLLVQNSKKCLFKKEPPVLVCEMTDSPQKTIKKQSLVDHLQQYRPTETFCDKDADRSTNGIYDKSSLPVSDLISKTEILSSKAQSSSSNKLSTNSVDTMSKSFINSKLESSTKRKMDVKPSAEREEENGLEAESSNSQKQSVINTSVDSINLLLPLKLDLKQKQIIKKFQMTKCNPQKSSLASIKDYFLTNKRQNLLKNAAPSTLNSTKLYLSGHLHHGMEAHGRITEEESEECDEKTTLLQNHDPSKRSRSQLKVEEKTLKLFSNFRKFGKTSDESSKRLRENKEEEEEKGLDWPTLTAKISERVNYLQKKDLKSWSTYAKGRSTGFSPRSEPAIPIRAKNKLNCSTQATNSLDLHPNVSSQDSFSTDSSTSFK